MLGTIQGSPFLYKKIIPEYKIIHLRNCYKVSQQMCLANNYIKVCLVTT